jgi:hypothetical protein
VNRPKWACGPGRRSALAARWWPRQTNMPFCPAARSHVVRDPPRSQTCATAPRLGREYATPHEALDERRDLTKRIRTCAPVRESAGARARAVRRHVAGVGNRALRHLGTQEFCRRDQCDVSGHPGRACAAGCLLAAARHDEEPDEQFPGRLTRKRSHLRCRAAARWCSRRTCSSKGGTGPLMARPGAITEMGRAATGDAERPQPERHPLSWALDAA